MAHILIGFAEALPAPEVVFSLLQAGHTVSAFAVTPKLPLRRLPLRQMVQLPDPACDAQATIAALQAFLQGPNSPDVILPLDDAGLWLTSATLGADSRSAGARGQQVRCALNKRLQIEAARQAGLCVPKTVMIETPGDLSQPFVLPAIAKPALAIRVRAGRLGKGGTTYLSNPADVEALRLSLSDDMEPLLVQSLIQGTGEGVFGYATPQGVAGWSGHRRVRMMNPHGSGSSACISQTPSDELKGKIAAFLAAIEWHGPFMMEFLRAPDGTAWFMELNGRMWGSLALARRQGLEYPAWAVAGALDWNFRPDPGPVSSQPLLLRNLGRDLLHLFFVIRGPKSKFHDQDWPNLWKSLIEVLTPAHPRNFYNYDPAHRSFFLWDAIWTLRRALKR